MARICSKDILKDVNKILLAFMLILANADVAYGWINGLFKNDTDDVKKELMC